MGATVTTMTSANQADTHTAGHYTTTGLDSRKIAIWAFIGSECMLFTSLISTYLIYKGRSLVGPFPHEYYCPSTNATAGAENAAAFLRQCPGALKPILNIPVTSASTFVLLMSSLCMVLAHNAVVNADNPQRARWNSSKLWLAMTAVLGATFLGFQAYEFTSFVHEGLTIRTNLFGSSFFTLTGFHGGHVTAGVIWLLALLAIDVKRGLRPGDALAVDLAALYWHFVDVVWIVIFTLVYLIQ
ncbi:cytochrome o ubiquinol oxidase subunit III [Gemmatimonadetes bacterium T265]|nr:cytochrome o ubiquinol oxidase subunit III [Gemmatimonadetes bacterium T265]